jgi:hypothetical protein
MERFGVLPALMILPASVGLGSLGVVASAGALAAVAVPRAADIALKYSVNDSAFNLLFLPLRADARARAKALIDGIIKPPVVALLGLLFLFLDRFARPSVVQWSIPVLALVALWSFLLVRAERRYVSALAQSIALRRFNPALDELALSDEASRRVLAASLRSANPAMVIHALQLLRGRAGDFSEDLRPLLTHSVAEVRAATLDAMAERPIAELLGEIQERMQDDDAMVREAAIRAYGTALGARAVPGLSARLLDARASVRGAAVAALVQHGGLAGFLHAGGPLHAMLGADDESERREGAHVLGLLGVPSFYHPLLELIADPARSVRLAAIQAAERVAAPELLPAFVASTSRAGAAPARDRGDRGVRWGRSVDPGRGAPQSRAAARAALPGRAQFASIRAEGERASRARGRGRGRLGALGGDRRAVGPARGRGPPGCGPGALRAASSRPSCAWRSSVGCASTTCARRACRRRFCSRRSSAASPATARASSICCRSCIRTCWRLRCARRCCAVTGASARRPSS